MNKTSEDALRSKARDIAGAVAGCERFADDLVALARLHGYFVHKSQTRLGTEVIKKRLRSLKHRAAELARELDCVENAGAAVWIDEDAPGAAFTVEHEVGETLRLAGYRIPLELSTELAALAAASQRARTQAPGRTSVRDFRAATARELRALLKRYGLKPSKLSDTYQAIAIAAGDKVSSDPAALPETIAKRLYRARKRTPL